MGKSKDLATLATTLNNGVNLQPNLIINSDMAVSQRGTSETGITTSQYADAPDRWHILINTLGTWTASQSTTAPDGFGYSYKLECTTADASPSANDYLLFRQKIEGQNLQVLDSGSANAKKHTLSFWVRSSKTGTYHCEVEHVDGAVYNSIKYTINTADTWERKSVTFDGYQTTAIANDNTNGYQVQWWLGSGTDFNSGTHNSNTWHSTNANRAVGNVNLADSTSNEWYITGVSLVVGDKAPVTHPYESYADNLQRCQRYYEQWDTVSGENVTIGTSYSGSNPHAILDMKVIKRAAPTVTLPPAGSTTGQMAFLAGTGNTPSTIGTHYTDRLNTRSIRIGSSGYGGISSSQPSSIYAYGGSSSFKFDAEL